MRRGDVFLVDLGVPRGSEAGSRRPGIVVSTNAASAAVERLGRGAVTIVPVTSSIRTVLPFHVLLDAGDGGLPRESKAQAEHVRTVSADRLGEQLGRLSESAMEQLDGALRLHLAL